MVQNYEQKIRDLNDQFRATLSESDVVFDRVLSDQPAIIRDEAIAVVRAAANFDNNEHRTGIVQAAHIPCIWTIDYLDLTKNKPSDNPADPSCTIRKMHIKASSEF